VFAKDYVSGWNPPAQRMGGELGVVVCCV
jgi:hypothetical protein